MLSRPNNPDTTRRHSDPDYKRHDHPDKEKHDLIDFAQGNLIDFEDNLAKSPQKSGKHIKEKQISELQHKMLEEFCSTSKIKYNKLKESLSPEELEFKKFFDKIEYQSNIKPLPPIRKLQNDDLREFEQIDDKIYDKTFEENACASNYDYHLDIAQKVLIPKLDSDGKTEPENKYNQRESPRKYEDPPLENSMFFQNDSVMALSNHLEFPCKLNFSPESDSLSSPDQKYVKEEMKNIFVSNTLQTIPTAEMKTTNVDKQKSYVDQNNLFEESASQHAMKKVLEDFDEYWKNYKKRTAMRVQNLESLLDQVTKRTNEQEGSLKTNSGNSNNHSQAGPEPHNYEYEDFLKKRALKEESILELFYSLGDLYSERTDSPRTSPDNDEDSWKTKNKNQTAEEMVPEHDFKNFDVKNNIDMSIQMQDELISDPANYVLSSDPCDNFDDYAVKNITKSYDTRFHYFNESLQNETKSQGNNLESFVHIKLEDTSNTNNENYDKTQPHAEYSPDFILNGEEEHRNRINNLESLIEQLEIHNDAYSSYKETSSSPKYDGPLSDAKKQLLQKEYAEKMVNEKNHKYLEGMQKTEKIFKKKSVLISDSEKRGLNRGPGLLQKMVYLPGILNRVEERRKDPSKMRPIFGVKKVISESSLNLPSNQKLNTLNLETLQADCNRERLKAFEVARHYNNFVRYNSS